IERLSTLLSSLAVSVAKSMGVGGARKQIRSQRPNEREISAFGLETTHRGVGAIFHLPGKKKVIKTSESPHRISEQITLS
ncbi:hypothetical protein BD769DRAFT_1519165, partial [Suillus cothurnatus]